MDYFALSKGYTGHEMLDSLGLIHMGGRVYDPSLGRFLSADIVISDPYNPQRYNRYSYVLNNPLSAVDPSGYDESFLMSGLANRNEGWSHGVSGGWADAMRYSIAKARGGDAWANYLTDRALTNDSSVTFLTKKVQTTVQRVDAKTGIVFESRMETRTEIVGVSLGGGAGLGFAQKGLPGKEGSNSSNLSLEEGNLLKAQGAFRRLYEAGLLPEKYNFISTWEGGLDNDAFRFQFISESTPGRVAEMDIYKYQGATVFKGGASTFVNALDTVAHEIYHLESYNQELWKSGDLFKRGMAQRQATRAGGEVVRIWEKNK